MWSSMGKGNVHVAVCSFICLLPQHSSTVVQALLTCCWLLCLCMGVNETQMGSFALGIAVASCYEEGKQGGVSPHVSTWDTWETKVESEQKPGCGGSCPLLGGSCFEGGLGVMHCLLLGVCAELCLSPTQVVFLEKRVTELEKDTAANGEQHSRLKQENLQLVHR